MRLTVRAERVDRRPDLGQLRSDLIRYRQQLPFFSVQRLQDVHRVLRFEFLPQVYIFMNAAT
jgi:hypothetical protein